MRYGFDYDAARDAVITLHTKNTLSFPLIGPPSSYGGFTFGPWYYYILTLGSLFFPTVYAPWIVIGIVSVLTILVYYKIGVTIRDSRLGLILAALFGLSSSQVIIGTGLSNPDFVPFFASVSILLFFLYLKNPLPKKWILLWGMLLGIGLNIHYQMVGLLILPLVAVIYKRKSILITFTLLFIGGFISYVPFLIYDLQNSWYNIRGITQYITQGPQNYVPNRWLFYVRDFWPELWGHTLGFSKPLSIITIGFTAVTLVYLAIRKQLSIVMVLFLITFGLNFLYFRYYSGERAVYYFYFIQPFIYILLGFSVYHIIITKKIRYVGLVICVILIAGLLPESIRQFKPQESHMESLKIENSLIKKYPEAQFAIYNCGGHEKNISYALYLLLREQGKISQNTNKVVGIWYKGFCQNEQKITEVGTSMGNFTIVDLAFKDKKKLVKEKWLPVVPDVIYNSVLYWMGNDDIEKYSDLKILF